MKKAELVAAIVEKTGAKKKDVEAFVKAFVETVEEALAKGEKVSLIGFGTFGVRERAARKGVNPKTGKPLMPRLHERALSRCTDEPSGVIEQSGVKQFELGDWISHITHT
jgi:DNA-binding protein HU-beta